MRQPDAWDRRLCKDCLEPFSLKPEEVSYYLTPGRYLPRRCAACRKARREREAARAQGEARPRWLRLR